MLRVLYAGSPEASAQTLRLLKEKESLFDFKIVGVLTNPPSAKGRHKELVPTFVGQVAKEFDLPVFSPEHLDSSAREEVKKINADILVVFAYGHILGPKFMELFNFGVLNLHPSALPKYRGPTPINAVILNGDKETALTVQKMNLKIDEGNILAQKKIVLNGTETAGTLLNNAAISGADMIVEILGKISKTGKISEGTVQSGIASYTTFIKKEDAKINWNDSVEKIDCVVRAYNPEPMAWTLENGVQLKIISGIPLSDEEAKAFGADFTSEPGTVALFAKQKGIFVKCKNGFFAVTKLQRQGKNAMNYKDFMNGAKDFVGKKLGF